MSRRWLAVCSFVFSCLVCSFVLALFLRFVHCCYLKYPGLRWYGTEWDGLGWIGMGWDQIRWVKGKMEWDGTGWDEFELYTAYTISMRRARGRARARAREIVI